MTRSAAFLRGVNLGRHRRVSSADLREAFTRAGCTDVATFRTSGNVAFTSAGIDESAIRVAVERSLRDVVGHDITVVLRSAEELHALVRDYPFVDDGSRGKPQVVFLLDRLDTDGAQSVLDASTEDDQLAVVGGDLCWWPRAGILESALDWASIGALVGSVTTTRTFGTVRQLVGKHLP
jgi:uncharacterized protein (DUF1697 family)